MSNIKSLRKEAKNLTNTKQPEQRVKGIGNSERKPERDYKKELETGHKLNPNQLQ